MGEGARPATPTRIVPLVVATALFMEQVDSTILTTALPTIARDLHVDPIALKLAITSYLVALAIFIPVSGWLADRYGARTVFRLALAMFMAASIGCAHSASLTGFVVWRFLQGMGGAMMVPVGRLVIVRAVPKPELVRAMAALTIPSLMGPLLGPPLGGLIVTTTDWRWIFYVNLPVGVAGIVLASLYFSDARAETGRLDAKGFVFSGMALSGLILGTAMLGRHIAPLWVAALTMLAGLAALFAYLAHARACPRPLLDLRLLALPTFHAGVVGGSLFRLGVGAATFLVPLMLQLGLGCDALTSGLLTLAGAAGAMGMKVLAPDLLRRLGFRRVLLVNGVLASLALVASAMFGPATPYAVIVAVLFGTGLLRSLQFTCLNAISYADIPAADLSAGTSLASVAQQVSVSFGVAIGAVALEAFQSWNGDAVPLTRDFSLALVAVALASLLSYLPLRRLAPDAGAEVAGRSRDLTAPE